MASLRHVATLAGGGAQFSMGITDLVIGWVGGGVQLYTITRPGGGGLSAFDIGGTGAAALLSAQAFVAGIGHLTTPQVAVVQGDGMTFLLPVGMQQAAAGAYLLGDSGAIGGRMRFATDAAPPADLIALTQVQTGPRSFVVAARDGMAQPVVFEMGAGRALNPVAAGGPQTAGPDLTALVAVTLADRAFVLAVSPLGNRITSYAIGAEGQIRLADVLDSVTSGIGFDRPVALAPVVLNGVAHVIVAAAGSSSLTVLRLMADGQMEPVEHVIDSLPTRFQTVTALETITLGDRVFVLAAGADDGISLFTLLPDGRLIHLSTLADTAAVTLNNVSAMAAAWAGGRAQVFVTSGAEAGVTQFTLDTGPPGVTRSGAAGVVGGSALNDLLIAGAGSAELWGGAGDDILVAAPLLGGAQAGAALRVWGGAGQDIFVPAAGGRALFIMDYEPGLDRLDLTLLPMLRSLQQMQITPTAQGARLRFGDTVIEIITQAGTPLALAHFTDAAMLGLTRYAPPQEPALLNGTEQADRLALGMAGGQAFGLSGNDTIYGGVGDAFIGGGAGDDLIYAQSGANRIWGGAGHDTVYGGDGADAIYGGDGRNELAGNDGNDTLFAGAAGDRMAGGAGNDQLYGGAGADTLYLGFGDDVAGGGAGDDVIVAGAGANRIWGGLGHDTVYGGTGSDAIYGGPGRNRLYGHDGGDLIFAGDEGDGIAGGAGHDTLYGGSGNDAIYLGLGNDVAGGGAGHDLIVAGAGANRIWGGLGHDTVQAGSGQDVITGGPGADVFVFVSALAAGLGAARDVITDFTPGTDHIDLHALDMTFSRSTGFTGSAGQLFYAAGPGGTGLVIGDVDGDGRADFVIALAGAPVITADDFLL